MLRKGLLVLAFALLMPLSSTLADDPIQSAGRFLGFGWGDGYHSQRTWPLHVSAPRRMAPAVKAAPTPAAPPKKAEPVKGEPASPSDKATDKPAAKTSMRRYPVK